MKLDHEAVKAVIPHRDPMLLVDTVEELEPAATPWRSMRPWLPSVRKKPLPPARRKSMSAVSWQLPAR